MFLHNGVANRQTEACTFSCRRSGIKRIENFVDVRLRYTATRICNPDTNIPGILFQSQLHRTAIRHGIDGIQQDVNQYLLNQVGYAFNQDG